MDTAKGIEDRFTKEWGRKAFVIPHRISGNRYVYAVSDHNGNYLSLDARWFGGRQVFTVRK